MRLRKRAEMCRRFVIEHEDGYDPDRWAEIALDDPAAFALAALSHLVRGLGGRLP